MKKQFKLGVIGGGFMANAILKGLIYFTDGYGIYPNKMPPYRTAFVFLEEDYRDVDVPPWAVRLVIRSRYDMPPAQVLRSAAEQVLGTLADQKGYKKKLFLGSLLLGVAGCVLLGFVHGWLLFLALFVVTRVGYSVSLIFYDSMLVDVTTPERMDRSPF